MRGCESPGWLWPADVIPSLPLGVTGRRQERSDSSLDAADQASSRTATVSKALPSSISSDAPPPVETWLTRSA